jgi:hypothetical protein
MITYKSYIRLKEGKVNSKAFTEQEYELFVKSPLREKIMEKFKNDFTVMKMFFEELMKKVEGHISSYEGPLPDNLQRIKKICNQSLCPKELFSQIFAESIDELYEICKKALARDTGCRELVQLTFLVNEALKLKKGEMETSEFSMIYDQEEKLSNEELMRVFRYTVQVIGERKVSEVSGQLVETTAREENTEKR